MPPRRPSVFDEAFLTGTEDVGHVLLIRHGQQEFDPNGTVKELIDPPLSELGHQQARLLGESLAGQSFAGIYVSPLKRAAETARPVAAEQKVEPQIVNDLREVEIFRDVPREEKPGQYIGRDLLEAARRRMLEERSWDVYPYSESSHEFRKRVVNAVESIIIANQGERIAIVCHGGVINAYFAHLIDSRSDMFFRPAHTAVSVVRAGRRRRALHSLNDVHHLSTAEGEFTTY